MSNKFIESYLQFFFTSVVGINLINKINKNINVNIPNYTFRANKNKKKEININLNNFINHKNVYTQISNLEKINNDVYIHLGKNQLYLVINENFKSGKIKLCIDILK